MEVTSTAIVNGEFKDKYGKRDGQFNPSGMSTYSVPFKISSTPEGTKSFAVALEDKDVVTTSGFVWIHWLIADLEHTSVMESESVSAKDYVRGTNSWVGVLDKFEIKEASCYGGMTPPNYRHHYKLIVYTSDTRLNPPHDSRFSDLHSAMQGHVLVSASVMGTYGV